MGAWGLLAPWPKQLASTNNTFLLPLPSFLPPLPPFPPLLPQPLISPRPPFLLPHFLLPKGGNKSYTKTQTFFHHHLKHRVAPGAPMSLQTPPCSPRRNRPRPSPTGPLQSLIMPAIKHRTTLSSSALLGREQVGVCDCLTRRTSNGGRCLHCGRKEATVFSPKNLTSFLNQYPCLLSCVIFPRSIHR